MNTYLVKTYLHHHAYGTCYTRSYAVMAKSEENARKLVLEDIELIPEDDSHEYIKSVEILPQREQIVMLELNGNDPVFE